MKVNLVIEQASGEGFSTNVPLLERVWGVLFCSL
jgi:hypothetical protein